MKTAISSLALAALIALTAIGCKKEEAPNPNQIPIIRETVYHLQQAVKNRDRAALDSLLSSRIIDNGQSSDSLLSFCYGPDRNFPFDRFGDCEYFYTNNRALARCYVMDSTGSRDRPIRFTFEHRETGPKKHRKSLWLLTGFDQKELSVEPPDTTAADTNTADTTR